MQVKITFSLCARPTLNICTPNPLKPFILFYLKAAAMPHFPATSFFSNGSRPPFCIFNCRLFSFTVGIWQSKEPLTIQIVLRFIPLSNYFRYWFVFFNFPREYILNFIKFHALSPSFPINSVYLFNNLILTIASLLIWFLFHIKSVANFLCV